MNNIVILGGTFDPIHYGHIRMAEHIITNGYAKQCIWVPNKLPLLKSNAQATTQQRLDMLSLAIQQSNQRKQFSIDLCEIERDGPSYTVETLHYFRNQLGKNQSISLLMGEDAFVHLNQWYKWEQITSLSHIIIATRPAQTPSWPQEISTFFHKNKCSDKLQLQDKPAGLVYLLEISVDASSTDVRKHLSQHPRLEEICPKLVADYISEHRLYR